MGETGQLAVRLPEPEPDNQVPYQEVLAMQSIKLLLRLINITKRKQET